MDRRWQQPLWPELGLHGPLHGRDAVPERQQLPLQHPSALATRKASSPPPPPRDRHWHSILHGNLPLFDCLDLRFLLLLLLLPDRRPLLPLRIWTMFVNIVLYFHVEYFSCSLFVLNRLNKEFQLQTIYLFI